MAFAFSTPLIWSIAYSKDNGHISDRTGILLLIPQIAFQDSLAASMYTNGQQFGY
ncbi:hypothetical protein KUH03_37150 [Sphingobacterium sp. E70]|uniref:hypothetical protein n=1 Tax=Sphingobacterium sp. E70 TaxID=2853439 RepID=UPI00211CEFF7|nr:hypothetical protein [Sphingobacterium sp. E70]ULT24530.1 hypothetical protein KUH03_37150 [Sphingobacterium sp. E70]